MKRLETYLSKREQQIMELVYEHGQITTAQAMELLPGSPANSTVRTFLKILETKGHLKRKEVAGKYVFTPVRPKKSAAREALERVLHTFYRGSVSDVIVALMSDSKTKLTEEEVARLEALIREAQDEGR